MSTCEKWLAKNGDSGLRIKVSRLARSRQTKRPTPRSQGGKLTFRIRYSGNPIPDEETEKNSDGSNKRFGRLAQRELLDTYR
jgi:hypothetical protein